MEVEGRSAEAPSTPAALSGPLPGEKRKRMSKCDVSAMGQFACHCGKKFGSNSGMRRHRKKHRCGDVVTETNYVMSPREEGDIVVASGACVARVNIDFLEYAGPKRQGHLSLPGPATH
jgi:hypothetical protein